MPSDFPWDDYPQFEALAQFGVALGAARSDSLVKATTAILRLIELEKATAHTYWKNQVKVMRLASQAWLAEVAGNEARAVASMKESAELEAGMSKHPITPGEILPSGELLGDMMMLRGDHKTALAAYESALERTPNRFNSLYGAGQAAEALGEAEKAAEYYRQLVHVCDEADTEREELVHARSFVAGV
jgi:tetratricopeptide (TPR) repeat protein